MERRAFISGMAGSLLAAPFAAEAQQAGKIARIGYLAPRAERRDFEDIPVPKGLELDWSRSTIIESPTIKAARLFYKGRITPDSLAVAFRSTLEANGWHHLSTTTTDRGATQVYEKAGSSLQVLIYEGWYYTWAEVSATRVIGRELAPAR